MAEERIKVFLDSNVILSGFISEKAAPRLILDLLCHDLPFLHAATGQYNMEEIERTMARKLPAVRPVFEHYMSKLMLQVVPVPSQEELKEYRGAVADEDLPVLVSAIRWGGDYLVTGDKKHFGGLRGSKIIPIKIRTPSEFISILAAVLRRIS